MRILATVARAALAVALLDIGTLVLAPRPARAERPVPITAAQGEPTERSGAAPGDDDFAFEYDEQPSGFPDPMERGNRRILWFDQQLTRYVVDPVTKTYQFLVPDVARLCVRRFFRNVNSPSVLINDLLQREWGDAAVTVERFAVNTTVGIGGLFDPADHFGLEPHTSDFGQTLALAGVGSGPYLVLPFFGPNTARDAVGDVVDFFFQPTLYFLPFAQIVIYEGSLGLSTGLSMRDAYAESLTALQSSSVDYYSALHNAYYQNRMAEIWARREDHRPTAAPAPDETGTAVAQSN